MRFTIIILLACGVIVYEAVCRPSQAADNESEEETEYDGKEDEDADNYLNEKTADTDSQVMDSLNTYNSRGSEIQEDSYNRRPHVSLKHSSAKNNEYGNLFEDKPEYKSERCNQGNEQEISLSDRSQSNPNLGNEENGEDEDRIEQPVPNSRYNSYKKNDENNNEAKYQDVTLSSEDGTMLEGERRLIKDNGGYNNEAVEAPEEPLYKHITYFKKVQSDFSKKRKPGSILNLNRNRRQTTKDIHEEVISDNKKDKIENNNEDNESAIKRNIKKLSREELEDLLNSLSDDKKALLKKIMDNKVINDSVNKREITKKSGAVEENNFESGPSDFSKVESRSSIDSISSISQSETTDTTRQSVGNDATKSKDLDTENASSKTDGKEELIDENLSENQQSLHEQSDFIVEPKFVIGKEILKNENKRETNLEDLTQETSEVIHEPSIYGHYGSLDNEMDCVKDDNWSKLMKDESELQKTYSNIDKRGVYDNSAEVKSLEDSFPNYDETNSKYPDSHLAPLIRVKRTNSNVIKREAGHCANMKVPFFPGAVSDDIDDNEKNEFDDGGILEKSYNYERVGKGSNRINDFSIHNERKQPSYGNKNNFEIRFKKYSKFKSGFDSANIGSDTDNILTNVEGVDDNLMYNNNINTARKKCLAYDPNINKEIETMENNLLPEEPLTLVKDNISIVVPDNNLSRYPENVAIGSIPRNSDEELARFKRIRRLNQSPSSQDNLQNTDKL